MGKTPHPRKPTRHERRQAARNDARARQTVETASPLTATTSYSRQDVLAFVALGLLVVVPYLPAMLWGGFVWDDLIITNSEAVQKVSGLWKIWFSPSAIGEEGHYWPLVYTTFWLEHKLWGYAPVGYHVVNVLLHLANVLLLWHLLLRLAVPGAWMVAAVFAVHPLHVESVAWIIEHKDVLSGLFYLAAVLAWMRFVEQPNPRRYVWSLALYVAGLLSKSIVITLPVALLIWHWWKQGRATSTDLLRLVPFCVVGLVIAVGDLSFYQSVEPLSLGYSLTERTLIATRALWFYAGKLLWPTNLAVIYPLWDIRVADPLAWGYLIAAVALVVTLWHFRPQLGRGSLAGTLFFAVTLLPVLGFIDYGYIQYAFVADRFQYLAGIGVMAVVIGAAAYGVCRLSDLWQKGALGVAVVALVGLGMLTWRQASIYRNNETLNRHIIALNPQARNAHLNLGRLLYNQAQYEEALEVARVAVEQRPDYSKAHDYLGAILNALGRIDEAEIHLRRAIALNPQEKYAHFNLGNTLCEQGRYEEALEVARVAVEQHPDFARAHTTLGIASIGLGRFEEGETHLRRAIALNPRTQNVYLNLGMTLYYQGRYEEALDAARVAVEQRPDFALAHANLGLALNALGRSEEAETHLRRALDLNPQDVNTFQKLIEILTPPGRGEEAIDLIAQAAALAPDSTQAAELHFLIGQTARENGQSEAAAEHYMHTLNVDPHHGEALHWLASLRAEQQRYGEMLELLQRLIALHSNDAATYSNMGIALFYLGRHDEALQHFDQALSLDPTLENVRANREGLIEALGNVE
jgi:tetratricopeptide (TPR) repeat protein